MASRNSLNCKPSSIKAQQLTADFKTIASYSVALAFFLLLVLLSLLSSAAVVQLFIFVTVFPAPTSQVFPPIPMSPEIPEFFLSSLFFPHHSSFPFLLYLKDITGSLFAEIFCECVLIVLYKSSFFYRGI